MAVLRRGMDADAATARARGVDAGGQAVGEGPGLSVLVERAGGGALRVVGDPTPQSRGCSDTRRSDRLTNATTVQPLTIPSR